MVDRAFVREMKTVDQIAGLVSNRRFHRVGRDQFGNASEMLRLDPKGRQDIQTVLLVHARGKGLDHFANRVVILEKVVDIQLVVVDQLGNVIAILFKNVSKR